MLLGHEDYRSFLKHHLQEQVRTNPAYSLRAFARRLNVSSSYLSEVLAGKKSLSPDVALKVATRLDLAENESRYFCLLAQLESQKDPRVRAKLAESLISLYPQRKTLDLSVELFHTIADWYHFAILELSALDSFKLSARSAAQRLNISFMQAKLAIERLLRLELLEKTKEGRLKKTPAYVLAESSVSHAALKSFHSQILEKAILALHTQVPSERVSSSDVVPIDARDVGAVKKLSDKFTADLLKISEKAKRKDQVYCLSVQFFNLSSEKKGSHVTKTK